MCLCYYAYVYHAPFPSLTRSTLHWLRSFAHQEIEEDRYDEWLEKGRYPKAIIMKMKRCTTTLKEIEAKKAGPAPTIDLTVDKHLEKLNFKVTTLIALRMQGICGVKDLRLW